MDCEPQIGHLVYHKRGRWDIFGMVVEQMIDNRWVIEWYHPYATPQRSIGYEAETIIKFHQEYLQMRSELSI